MKIKLLSTILLLLCLTAVTAAPFKNVERILTQPDGTILHCYASGDEFYNRLHDINGYTIVQAENGYFVYATTDAQGKIVATQHVAGKSDPKSLGLEPNISISRKEYLQKRDRMRVSKNRDLSKLNHGVYNNIVVFIKFKNDADLGISYTKIDSMFNHNGYYDISMNNYYKKATYNQLSMVSYCYPKADGDKILAYEDVYPRRYYMPYNATTNPDGYKENERGPREFDLLKRAIEYIAPEVPKSLNIDRNNDGLVDNVIFVVKGNAGDWSDLLWPHMWELRGEDVYINEKRVMNFNFQLESSTFFTVSTLCHEMAHSLGFPDLYHYEPQYDHLSPAGPWDLMSNNSQPPQHTGTYMKYKYGTWIDEIPEIGYGTYTIEANSWEGGRRNCYKIPTSDMNQYYLVEYRNKNNTFEKGLPDGGLLIYRLDTRYNGCIEYNANDILDELYIFRPSGTYNSDGHISAAVFCAENNKTEFNSTTDPQPFLNFNKKDDIINICNISTRGDQMSFSYLPPNSDIIPTNLTANVKKDEYVELKWDSITNADSYNIYRDGILIADNITDNFYNDEYQNLNKGYHYYYVSSNCNGEESFHSNEDDIIVGGFCEYLFDMNCSGDNGWQGGEITLSFNNGMKDIYLTMYSGSNKQESIVVPANVEMSVNWTSGWDDSECSFTITNNSQEVYKSEKLKKGLLIKINTTADASCVIPQDLTANVSGYCVDLSWNTHVECDNFAILRNGEIIADNIKTNSYTDKMANASGTYRYNVISKNENCESLPSNTVTASLLRYSPDMIDVDAAFENNIVELNWDISQKNTNTINYDDGIYVTSEGSNNIYWGIKIPVEDLKIYKDAKITAVEIFDASEAFYNFSIYNGEKPDDKCLIHNEGFTTTNSNKFVTFNLSKDVDFDIDKDLWLIVKPKKSSNKPIPCGEFVGISNSNIIKVGNNWKSASEYDMNYSWLIRLNIEQPDAFAEKMSYNVYRQNELIASNLTATTYSDKEIIADSVCYNIRAIYNGIDIASSDDICLATILIPEEPEDEEVSPGLRPNPTQNYVTITDDSIKNVKIYSVLGNILFDEEVNCNELKVDMSCYSKGIYVIQVVTETETKSYKVVRN